MMIDHDPRLVAEETFRDQLAPLIALGEEHQDATEVFVDGDEIRLSFGDVRLPFSFRDFGAGFSPRNIQAAANAAAAFAGLEFGPQPPAKPYLSVKMPPDLRATFSRPPVSERWHMALRFLRSRSLTLESYVAGGVMTEAQMREIRSLVAQRRTMLISGGTGTGKTTLLRAILAEITDKERLTVIEDTPELALTGDNILYLQTTLTVDMAELLRTTLRFTPDRIVVGEVRGPEALELVTANNTGHEGTLCTLHSNGATQALRRLHTQCRKVQPNFPFEEIELAFDVVLQLTGRGQGERRLSEIWHTPR